MAIEVEGVGFVDVLLAEVAEVETDRPLLIVVARIELDEHP